MAILDGGLEIPADELYGKVTFEPLIVVKRSVEGFNSPDLNEEFGDTKFDLLPGDIIGMAENLVKYVDYNRLEFESLVKARRSEDIDEYAYQVELTGSLIFVYMGIRLHEVFENLKLIAKLGQCLRCLFKDRILIALEQLAKDPTNG